MNIHPLAVVSPRAQLGPHVSIGPFTIIEDDVVIGANCRIGAQSIIKNGVRLGDDNEIAEHVVLGGEPQHLKKNKDLGLLIVGHRNTIREFSNFHRSMKPGEATVIGDDNLFMAGSHIAHDCRLGNNIVTANNVLFAGHVVIEDRAFVSGGVGIHQHCRVGRLAMLGGHAKVVQDVPPYTMIETNGCVVGLNLIGLRRAGYTTDQIAELKRAYRVIYRRSLGWSAVLEQLKAEFTAGPAADFHPFLSKGTRGFCQERRMPPRATLKLRTGESEESAAPTTTTAVTPISPTDLDTKSKVG